MSHKQHESGERITDTIEAGQEISSAEEILDQNLARLLKHAKEPPRLAPEARARILKALKEKQKAPPQEAKIIPLRRTYRAAGAIVALAAAAALLLLLWPGAQTPPSVYQNTGAAVETITLPDGSTLLLRQGARVVALGARHLSLEEGDVLLDVAKGEAPFQVDAPHGTVTVLGTRFALKVTREETRAAVIRGVVQLESAGERALLHAGEEGLLQKHSPPTRRPADRLSYLTGWAKEARQRGLISDEAPARSGILLARNPQWQSQEWSLPLRRFVVDVHIEDQVARVALDQTFFNPAPMTLEGVYSFPLPADAAISRMAMYVDGKLMEGGIVERQHGRQVYESIVYQRRDPALLEWMQGNAFRLRIFPLPARTEKRILLSYTQTLPRLYDGYRLEVPIPAVEQPVGEILYQVRLKDGAGLLVSSSSHEIETRADGSDQLVTISRKNEPLGGDLILHLTEKAPSSTRASFFKDKDGAYLLVGATPKLSGEARYEPRRWVLLHDTSASRGPLERKAQIFLASRFLEEWDEDDEFAVIAFDATVRVMSSSFQRVGDVDPEAVTRFLEKESQDGVGYTDLEAGFVEAINLLGDGGGRAPYLLYLGDGIDTSKKPDIDRLRRVVEGKARVVAVAVGAQVDAPTLRALTEATGGLFTTVNPGEDLSWRAFDLIATLNTPRVLGVSAALLDEAGEPLKDAVVYPSSRQLAAGEELVVVAKLGDTRPATLSLTGTKENEAWREDFVIPEGKEGAGYLPRLFAQRRIDALLVDGAEKHQAEITALGMAHFLVTPFTSLLVLENDEMYKEFQVNRGSEDDWARYPAPKTIPVQYEPLGGSINLSIPEGATLVRTPVSVFGSYGYSYRRAAESGFQVLMKADGFAQVTTELAAAETRRESLSISGTGAGGGGNSEFFLEEAEESNVVARSITVSAQHGPVSSSSWTTPGADLPSARPVALELDDRRDVIDSISTGTLVLGAFDKSGALSGERPGWGGLFVESKKAKKTHGWRSGGSYSQTIIPSAFSYAGDPHLDDLTEFVPGLFGSGFDQIREHLLRVLAKEQGSITPEALTLLKEARSRARAGRFVHDGVTLEVREDGKFRVSRTLSTGLKEEILYDGAALYHFYPDLGLAVMREVGFAEPVLLGELLPFVVPAPEHLGLIYHVTLSAPRTLKLTPVGDAAVSLEMRFDEEYRIASLRALSQNSDAEEIKFAYTSEALTLTRGEMHLSLQKEPAAAEAISFVPSAATLVRMPLRAPSHWEQEISRKAAGSAEWRALQHQRMASYAALGQASQSGAVLQEILKETGNLTRGEAVLASGGIRYQSAETRAKVQALLGKEDPVARYIEASGFYYAKNKPSLFDTLAKEQAGTLFGMLSSYRGFLTVQYSYTKSRQLEAYRRAKEFLSTYHYEPFRYIVGYQYSAYHYWQDPEGAVALWDEIAKSPAWRYAAQYEAARVLYNRGRYDEAATRFETAFEEAVAAGLLPTIDYALPYALQYSSRGQPAWQYFWSRWRARVLHAEDPAELIPFLEAVSLSGAWGDVDRVVASLKEKKLEDPALAARLVDVLYRLGKYDAAWAILSPWVEQKSPSPALLHLASTLSEARGRSGEAARYLEKTLSALDGESLPLSEVRTIYARLFGLYAHLSQAPQGEGEEDLQRALKTAAAWRRIDPDNPEIDILCANLFYALGRPDLAWRYLSTIIERRPAEGASYEKVAGVLEGEGKLKDADMLWSRAIEVEPTNPTWLYRRAQNLLTLGKQAEALPLLQKVEEGSWQERFAPVVRQAKELRKRFIKK